MPLLVYRCPERRPTTVSSAKRTLCGRAGRRKAASWLWAGLYWSMPGLPHLISGTGGGGEGRDKYVTGNLYHETSRCEQDLRNHLCFWACLFSVLRIRDVYPGFRSRIFSSRIRNKEFQFFNPTNYFWALGNRIRVVHPWSGSGFFTHPGSRRQKGIGFRNRNTAFFIKKAHDG